MKTQAYYGGQIKSEKQGDFSVIILDERGRRVTKVCNTLDDDFMRLTGSQHTRAYVGLDLSTCREIFTAASKGDSYRELDVIAVKPELLRR